MAGRINVCNVSIGYPNRSFDPSLIWSADGMYCMMMSSHALVCQYIVMQKKLSYTVIIYVLIWLYNKYTNVFISSYIYFRNLYPFFQIHELFRFEYLTILKTHKCSKNFFWNCKLFRKFLEWQTIQKKVHKIKDKMYPDTFGNWKRISRIRIYPDISGIRKYQ